MSDSNDIKAEVIAVFPDKVKISVGNIAAFSNEKSLKVGSYLRITDSEDCALIAIIVTVVLAVILVKVTFKLLGVAIAIGLGLLAYFVADKLFGKKI